METPVAAPAAAPVAAAPAASPAPVAAPSTAVPVAAPAASPETAPDVQPSAEPSAPQTSEDIIRQALEKAAEPNPEAEPAAAEPAAEPVKTAEELAAEAKPDAEPAAEPEVSDFAPSFEDGDFGPQNFMKEIAGDEGATKFFNDHPEVKNMVCAALRRDVETKDIRKIVPTVEAAKEMATAATQHMTFDNGFLAAKDPAKVNDFLSSMVQRALITDDQGQPLLDAQGKYQVHPALMNTFAHISNNKLSVFGQNAAVTGKLAPEMKPVLDGLRAYATKQGDDRMEAALDIISEAIPLSSQGSGEIPAELRPMADSLSQREQALNQKEQAARDQQQQEQLAKHTESVERVEAKCAQTIQSLLESQAFAKAGLTEFEKSAALSAIGEQIDAALDANELYRATYDSILQRPPSEARDAALRKHILLNTQEIIGPIATQVIRQAKGGQLDRQAAKHSQVAAQTAASKTDPRGASITAPGSQAKNIKDVMAEIRQQSPDMDIGQVMQEALKRSGGPKLG